VPVLELLLLVAVALAPAAPLILRRVTLPLTEPDASDTEDFNVEVEEFLVNFAVASFVVSLPAVVVAAVALRIFRCSAYEFT
jgi:hypothetical protein